MTKSMSWCALMVSGGILLALVIGAPRLLSDDNRFLREFVNHECLNLLGVILAITLASAAQLHLTLNEIEKRYKQPGGLSRTRAGVHNAALALICLFLLSVTIVAIKPLVSESAWQQSLFNGTMIFIVIWNILIMLSITRTIFAIKPDVDDET
jgi:hypothetical protein